MKTHVHQKERSIYSNAAVHQCLRHCRISIWPIQSCWKESNLVFIQTKRNMALLCLLKLLVFKLYLKSCFLHFDEKKSDIWFLWNMFYPKSISIFFSISPLYLQMTGSPLSAAKRLQFNLEVKPIPQVELMKNMPDILFPLFWIEEGVNLGREFTDKMKNSLFLWVNNHKLKTFHCQ